MPEKKEIKQSDLFSNVPKSTYTRKPEKEILEEAKEATETSVPDSYTKINLCTSGRLMAPQVLHFRNYTLEEAAELTELTDDNQYEVFSKILNNLVFEEFNCMNLHKEEVLQILLHLYATFWNPYIEKGYIIDETLTGDDFINNKNKGVAKINIGDMDFVDLLTEFKTPFSLKGPDKRKYTMRFPVIGDTVFSQKYIDIKYADEEKAFSGIKRMYTQGKEDQISTPEVKAYRDFLNKKLKEIILFEKSQMILKIDDEDIDDEEKLLAARSLPLDFWSYVSKLQVEDYTFGLVPEIKFKNEDGDEEIRRFQFRFVEVFPPMESEGDSGYSISFD